MNATAEPHLENTRGLEMEYASRIVIWIMWWVSTYRTPGTETK
jgi:hypothetical protein